MRFQLHEKVKYMALGALIAVVGFILGSMTKGIDAQSEDPNFQVIDGTLFVTKGIFVGDVVKESGVHISSDGGGSVSIMDEGESLNIMGVTPEGHSVSTLRSRDGQGGIVLKVPNDGDGVISTLDKYGKEYNWEPGSIEGAVRPQRESGAVRPQRESGAVRPQRESGAVRPQRESGAVTKAASTDGYKDPFSKGPFGVDSQKIMNKRGGDIEYKIAIVSDIDLDKNDDGTWYIDNCKLSSYLNMSLFFASPYPRRNALKDRDFIAFTARRESIFVMGKEVDYFVDANILDHISLQSVRFKMDDISNLSTPSQDMPPFASAKDFVSVTGVIMAVEIIENEDPEPDNPSDDLIDKAVMKCADSNLYIVDFDPHMYLSLDNSILNLKRPSQDAFGEGDVVTVTQTSPTGIIGSTFTAYYKEK